MAYDTVSPVKLSKDTASVITPVAITHGNTIKIPVTGKDNIIVYVVNSTGTEETITWTAGDFGARSVLGNLDVVFATTVEKCIVLETSRFLNADGNIYGEYSDGMTGFIWAVYVE